MIILDVIRQILHIERIYKGQIFQHPNLSVAVADMRHSGKGRARSEAFQPYPGGDFNNPDTTAFTGMTLEAHIIMGVI
jgi:hypothetical protein